jgi:glycosyltransferase involved in cell wall biosynthesis
MNKISVIIRNKNQALVLEFLLKNLTQRYLEDIDEIIVLDNLSIDGSDLVAKKYGAKLLEIQNFSYGGSANLAAESSKNDIIVIFSAHSFPVSHDFFKLIKEKFKGRENELAGLRCIHNSNDYSNYIKGISANQEPNGSGLMFAGSVFNKKVWEKLPFKSDIRTFEDKEWTTRVLKEGYLVEFVPSIFCYNIKRTKEQIFFRFKNEIVGSYQLWLNDYSFKSILKSFFISTASIFKNVIIDLFYTFKRLFFMIKFILNKPEKFD